MKERLKKLMFRALRPTLSDVYARLDHLESTLKARLDPVDAQLAVIHGGLPTLWKQAQATQDIALTVQLSLPGVVERLTRIENRLATTAIWRGGLSGSAVNYAGAPVPEMTAKYAAELGYWEAVVRRDALTTWNMPFAEIYGIWQRVRMTELGEFLGLGEGDRAFEALAGWAATRSAIEIGSGPYPSIALHRWKQAIAVDPLAEGYLAENLVPDVHHTGSVTFLAAAGESVPIPAGSMDIAVLENCLDHCDEPGLVVRECRRMLRPGGLMWLLVDLMDYRDSMHPHPFSEASITEMLAREGFQPVRTRIDDHKSHPNAYGEYRALLRCGDRPAESASVAAS